MEINRIEPRCWFTGMKDTLLQLMVYGKDLSSYKVRTTLPCRSVTVVPSDNSDCSVIYIDLLKDAVAGNYLLIFEKDSIVVHIDYELKPKVDRDYSKCTITNSDVVYLIMVDRFAKSSTIKVSKSGSDDWHGGDIGGIIERLDYLQDLGVTALWLTPVFKNSNNPYRIDDKRFATYHGYSATDFYDVDKHFGNLDDYKSLVEKAHSKGLKIIKDVIFNHCSINHRWLKSEPLPGWLNRYTKGQKCEKTNYKVTTVFDPYHSMVDIKDTVEGWFTETMPDLNLSNEHVLKYLTQMTIWWIETTGIDSIRMDTYLYSDFRSMMKWQERIVEEYPGFSVIAETWVPEASYTARIQNEIEKSVSSHNSTIVMDFAFQKRLEACYGNKSIYDREAQMYSHFVNDFLYVNPMSTLALIDNHDLPRWLAVNKSFKKMKQALAVLLTSPRIPQIYYGTEVLLSGDGKGTGDGNYRQDMFGKFDASQLSNSEAEMLDYVRRVLNWRKTSLAVAKGEMLHYIPQQGVYVYFRFYGDERVMVILNNTNKIVKLDTSMYYEGLDGALSGYDIITGQNLSLESEVLIKGNDVYILNLYKNER